MTQAWLADAVRRRRGHLTLRDLGLNLGISPSTLSRVEAGKMPSVKVFFADQFAEGKEYELARKLRAAVRQIDNYYHRINSIDFEGPASWGCRRPCSVTFRGHIFMMSDSNYTIPLEWSPRTSIRNLVQQLEAGGYGDDSKLPPRERKPSEEPKQVTFIQCI